MTSSTVVLPHLPFFEALANLSESSSEWRSTSAGLVTLRLFDAWVCEGPAAIATGSQNLRAVRQSIGAIDEHDATRALLWSIVDGMTASRSGRASTVMPKFLAYARALQDGSKWALAVDVYDTVLSYLDSVDDADLVIPATLMLGRCLRVLARWEEALAAYTTAGHLAAMLGDLRNALAARVGEASVALGRGNIPAAEIILDETIQRATELGFDEIRAGALHSRGSIARRRGEFDLAIRCRYEALELYTDQAAKDRVLGDLAVTFYDMGLIDAARDANLVLAETAREQHTRWVATINLLEIAVRDSREPAFERYRRELAAVDLPAPLAAHYYLYVGQGYQHFDKMEHAQRTLEHAVAFAAQHQVNEVMIKAEQSLEGLLTGQSVRMRPVPPTSEPSVAVREVASAIHRMCVLATVGE